MSRVRVGNAWAMPDDTAPNRPPSAVAAKAQPSEAVRHGRVAGPDAPTDAAPDAAPGADRPGAALLWGIAAVCCAIEVVLAASDAGWIGSPGWRPRTLQYAAFWAGLLYDWQPNYAGQPLAMFVTYAVLHSGPLHLAGNMLALAWLGPRVTAELGARGFAVVWGASVLGGGAAFGALSTSFSPMVGASGALFGLMGALVAVRYRRDGGRRRVLGITAGLVVLNVVTLVLEGGILAWQTHLGGYLAGAAAGALLPLHAPAPPDDGAGAAPVPDGPGRREDGPNST